MEGGLDWDAGFFCQATKQAGALLHDGEVQEEERRGSSLYFGFFSLSSPQPKLSKNAKLSKWWMLHPHTSLGSSLERSRIILPQSHKYTDIAFLREKPGHLTAKSYTIIFYPNSCSRASRLHPSHYCSCDITQLSPFTLRSTSLFA